MTIRHMNIFLEVYRRSSITAAAEALYMTQPAVTRVIHDIERHYGVQLFLRTGKRLIPSETAHRLFAYALHITDTFSQMDMQLRNWDTLGELRVGASITLGNFLLPQVATRMKQMHPRLRLQAQILPGEQLADRLLRGELDIAVIENHIAHEHLHAEPFARDKLVLILPPDHPLLEQPSVSLAQAASCDLLLRSSGSAGRAFLDHVFAAHHLALQPVWESVSTQAIIRAVSAGLGLSFLPLQLVQGDLAAGLIASRPVCDADLTRTSVIAWHRSKFVTESMQDFAALCREAAQPGQSI